MLQWQSQLEYALSTAQDNSSQDQTYCTEKKKERNDDETRVCAREEDEEKKKKHSSDDDTHGMEERNYVCTLTTTLCVCVCVYTCVLYRQLEQEAPHERVPDRAL